MAKKKQKRGKKLDWATAKTMCKLNAVEIQIAMELGMSPKSLTKNIPSPNQRWKVPVKVWIRELYEKKHGDRIPKIPAEFKNAKTRKKPPKTALVNQSMKLRNDQPICQPCQQLLTTISSNQEWRP